MRQLYFLSIVLMTIERASEHLALANTGFLLDETSFSLNSVITVLNKNSLASKVHLIEKYSREQQRALLKYNVPSSQLNADFYHEASTDTSIFLSRKSKSCAASTQVYLYQQLLLDPPPILALFQKIETDLGKQLGHHLIGPARLLFYLSSRAQELKRSPPVDGRESPVEYKLEVNLSSSKYTGTAYVSILFDAAKNQLPGDTVLRDSLPNQLSIRFMSSPVKVTITYLNHEILSPGATVANDLTRVTLEVQVDEFAFPPSLDCAQYMERAGRHDLFEGYDLRAPVRFTFEARTKPMFGPPHKHFITFDGTTQSLRIDSSRGQSQSSPAYLRQVMDLRTNRKYVIVEGAKDDEDDEKQELKLRSHCAATYLYGLDKSERTAPSVSSFLLGADKFNYMGLAEVRGIKARVYEAVSNQLPQWFSQPMLYTDEKGEPHFRVRGEPARQETGANKPTPGMNRYSVVVYVANDANLAIRPLLIEIYDRRIVKVSTFRRVLAAHLFDFIWELNGAPNGDSVEELFALQDLCSAGAGLDRYAELELLLEPQSPEETAKAKQWLESPARRRSSLMAALRDTFNLQTVMVYDLETRIANQAVQASFKVAEHPQQLYKLTFVGNARLTRTSPTVRSINADSLAECLRIIGLEQQSPIHLYFSEQTGICVLEAEKSKNSIIELSTYEHGELYKVDGLKDHEMDFRSGWLRDSKVEQLQQRSLTLRYLSPDSFFKLKTPEEVQMRIRSIRLKNFNFMNSILDEKAQVSTVPGFAFIDGASDVQQLAGAASQEVCKAACLASETCGSFSYCASKAACLLSSASLNSPLVRDQLAEQEVQHLRTGSRLVVRLGHDGETVELRRDLRCDLYNKIYIELFRSSLPARVKLNRLQVRHVSGIEDCAEICFVKSLQAIQRTAELGEQVDQLLELADEPSQQREALQRTHLDYRRAMVSFCSYFLYLEGSLTDQQRELIESKASPQGNSAAQAPKAEGYCAMEDTSKQSGDNSAPSDVGFVFDKYRFDFTSLYDKRYGFGLQRSPLDRGELTAYHSLTQFNSTDDLEFAILREAVQDGKNFQLELTADAATCAQQCFSQSSGLWPACASFDTIIMQHDWGQLTRCHLNSLMSSDRIVEPVAFQQGANLWHYEPRFGYVRQTAERLSELETVINEQPPLETGEGAGGYFILFVLMALSAASGFVLTQAITRRLQIGSYSNNPPLDQVVLPLE